MYEIFQKLLKEHGVTAYRVAKETGVTTATLTSWKQGKYTPKPEKMQKIADYFGVSLTYLMRRPKKSRSLNQRIKRISMKSLPIPSNFSSKTGLCLTAIRRLQKLSSLSCQLCRLAWKWQRKRIRRNTLQKSLKRIDVMNIKNWRILWLKVQYTESL